jgi:hypothetical protein
LQTLDYRVGKIHWRKFEKGKKCVKRFLLKDTAGGYICFSGKKGFKNLDKYPSQSRYWDFLAKNKFFETEVVKSIRSCGIEPTLDLRVDSEHNFIANGVVVHNTGIQRSGATPYGAWTTTSPDGKYSVGNTTFKKPICEMMIAQGAVYVATASVAYPDDLENKIKKALSIKGPKFILVHSPCPPAWKCDSSKSIEISRLAVDSGMFVVYEMEGNRFTVNMKPKFIPVEQYLRSQGRFKHLTNEEIARIQIRVNYDWKKLRRRYKKRFMAMGWFPNLPHVGKGEKKKESKEAKEDKGKEKKKTRFKERFGSKIHDMHIRKKKA